MTPPPAHDPAADRNADVDERLDHDHDPEAATDRSDEDDRQQQPPPGPDRPAEGQAPTG